MDQLRAVCAQLAAGFGAVRDCEWWKLPEADLLAAMDLLEHTARLGYAARVHLVAELDARGTADRAAASSTAALLRARLHLAAGDAAARVRAASMLLLRESASTGEELPADLPIAGAAFDAGELSADHTRVITTAVKAWPAGVDPDTRTLCERTLVDQARQVDPTQLGKIAEQIAVILDPDGTLDERDPTAKMELRLGARDQRTGLTKLTGTLDDIAVDIFTHATTALAKPMPAVDGVKDPRTAATRLAHAHTEALRLFLNAGAAPTSGGEKPHLTMVLDYDVLLGRLREAHLDTAGPLSPSRARRLACDAAIIPAVLGGASEPLDVGRAMRTVPTAIRRAITLRDKGCIAPGCHRPAAWCDAHHIQTWLDGGPTSVTNCCLLCTYHHDAVHRGDLTITTHPDGHPRVTHPAWLDPTQTPRRNTVHHNLHTARAATNHLRNSKSNSNRRQ